MKTSYGWKLLPYLWPYRLRFLWALLHNVVDRLVLADARLAQPN